MAGDWIKMRNDLADDPAVIDIAAKLGLDEFAVIGRLHLLWAWADEQSRDGHAPGVTGSWIDRKVQCPGFAEALVSVRWLEVSEKGVSIPNFENHNGATAKTRALGSNRQQKRRGTVTSVTPTVTPEHAKVSRTERDKSVTREEKRREERDTPKAPKGAVKRFEEFWLAWPKGERKQDRAKCSEKWRRDALDESADAILADIRVKRGTEKWREGYIESPLVYLNGRRWEDGAEAGAAQAQEEFV